MVPLTVYDSVPGVVGGVVSTVVPVRVTVLLFPDWLPAPSRARTKYDTVTVVGWVSVQVVVPAPTLVARVPLRYTSYPARPLPPVSVEAPQDRLMDVPFWVYDSVPGTVGGVVSPVPGP